MPCRFNTEGMTMTKKIARKVNGVPQVLVVSDKKADHLVSKGWYVVSDPKPRKKKAPAPKPAPVQEADE